MSTSKRTMTVPTEHFEVADQRGRTYNVTRYLWLIDATPHQSAKKLWQEDYTMYLVNTGGFLTQRTEDDFEFEDSGTPLRRV